MFTGLVECTTEVLDISPVEGGARFSFISPFEEMPSLGDSIAINGCCLTVSAIEGKKLFFDLLAQTMQVTGLGDLTKGSKINLERAMRMGDRFGGHIVQGHVDGTGIVKAVEPVGQDYRLEVEIPVFLRKYCIDKGSLTIEGISLTIANLLPYGAEFWITPHTFAQTNLSTRQSGQRVNLEVDVLAKYVESLLTARS